MRNAFSKGCRFGIGAMALTAGLAAAQGEMKGPPGPGLLEGQAPPQGPLKRGRRPAPGPVPGPLIELRTRNSTNAPAWVTLQRDGNFFHGSCLAPGEERIWALPGDADRTAWNVSGKMTRDPRCREPVECQASIDRRPGMVSLELAARGPACGWRPMRTESAPTVSSQRRQILAPVENKTGAYVWVSLFTPPRRGTMELLDTMCMGPHEAAGFGVYERVAYIIEASVRMGEGCMMSAGCEAKLSYVGSHQPVRFEGNERSCRWAP